MNTHRRVTSTNKELDINMHGIRKSPIMPHFNNYLKRKDAKALIDSGVKEVTLTPTASKQTPEKTIAILEEAGVRITVEGTRGRPRRLSDKDVRRILAIRGSEVSVYKIATITGIPKSTVHDYLKRNCDIDICEEEVDRAQFQEAHRIFTTILAQNLSEEINRLAQRGFETRNVGEMEYLANEIKEIIQDPDHYDTTLI